MNRWLKGIGALLLAAAVGASLLPGEAEAAVLNGTATGTVISNTTTVRWTSGAATQDTTTTSAGGSDTSLRSVYADTFNEFDTQSIGVGQATTYTYNIINNGNSTDSFRVKINAAAMGAGAASWTCTLVVGTTSTATVDSHLQTGLVAAGAAYSCSVVVTSSVTPANSPDNSFLQFWLEAGSMNDSAFAQYNGDNGHTYAYGGGRDQDTAWALVASATCTIVKVVNHVTLGGVDTTPRPGATIEYKLTYTKTGSGAADSVIIFDTIPTNTTAFQMSNPSAVLGSDTNFENDSGASGWQAQYATAASPNPAFYSADFISWDGAGSFPAATIDPTVIRWTVQHLGIESKSLYFRVTID